MRFEITATCDDRLEYLLDEYPVLKNYGLTREQLTRTWESRKGILSRVDNVCFVELNSFEDLTRLIRDVENDVVISQSHWDSNFIIEIYDGYRE